MCDYAIIQLFQMQMCIHLFVQWRSLRSTIMSQVAEVTLEEWLMEEDVEDTGRPYALLDSSSTIDMLRRLECQAT